MIVTGQGRDNDQRGIIPQLKPTKQLHIRQEKFLYFLRGSFPILLCAFDQSMISELLAIGQGSLSDAVGEQQQAIAFSKLHPRILILPVGEHSEHSSPIGKLLHVATSTQYDRMKMSG